MSSLILGDHDKAALLARAIVKDKIDVGDIASVLTESIKDDGVYDELYTAVDSEYPALKQRFEDLDDRIDDLPNEEAKKVCGEYSELLRTMEFAQTISFFHLGFAAALQLLGRKS